MGVPLVFHCRLIGVLPETVTEKLNGRPVKRTAACDCLTIAGAAATTGKATELVIEPYTLVTITAKVGVPTARLLAVKFVVVTPVGIPLLVHI